MALWKREVEVFLPACTGTDLLSFVSPVCMGGPASVRKGVTGSWQRPFCHLASAPEKQDVMKIKQINRSLKCLGSLFFSLLHLVN